MYLNVHGEKFEINDENAVLYTGDTLINGVYADYNTEYLFIPLEAIEEPDVLLDIVEEEGVPVVELYRYDPEDEPFCFIINALCRYFRREIDYLEE